MKTQKLQAMLMIVLLFTGLFTGCTLRSVQMLFREESAAPTQPAVQESTEAPAEIPAEVPTDAPTEVPTKPLDEARLAAFQELFSWEGDMIFSRAAGHAYESPAEVDLYYVFYNGVDCPGHWVTIPESERALLLAEGFWEEMDIQLLPAELLEEKLQRYFGVGLEDVQIPDHWVYSSDTDTYYSNHNDAYATAVTVTGYTDLPDGTVVLHLTVDCAHDHAFEEVVWDAPMDMKIRCTEDGWQIISNVPAES